MEHSYTAMCTSTSGMRKTQEQLYATGLLYEHTLHMHRQCTVDTHRVYMYVHAPHVDICPSGTCVHTRAYLVQGPRYIPASPGPWSSDQARSSLPATAPPSKASPIPVPLFLVQNLSCKSRPPNEWPMCCIRPPSEWPMYCVVAHPMNCFRPRSNVKPIWNENWERDFLIGHENWKKTMVIIFLWNLALSII